MNTLRKYMKMIRVKQWIKNIIVLLPFIFGKILDNETIRNGICAFFSFCCLASAVYIMNDIKDIESDRKHPVKCMRIIASGEISIFNARITQIFLLLLGLLFIWISNCNNIGSAFIIYGIYLCINVFYTFKGKDIQLLDIFILALGFLLRLYFGSVMESVEVSAWLYLVIIFGAFYLGLGKRRNELSLLENDSNREGRKVLKKYSYQFLDKNMYSCQTLIIVFYSLWCANYPQEDKRSILLCTIPVVMLIAMKYSSAIEQEDAEGDPTDMIIGDRFLLGLIVVYAVLLLAVIYV